MADFVEVVEYVKTAFGLPSSIPVFAWGGSYAGELATYMRVAYPDQIHAAYSCLDWLYS